MEINVTGRLDMKRINVITLLLICLFGVNSYSEDVINKCVDDFRWIVTSPARIKKTDILPLSVFAGSVGVLMVVDEDIRLFAQNPDHRNKALDGIFSFTGGLGGALVNVPVIGAFYLAGVGFKDEKLKRIGVLSAESLAFTGLIAITIKCIIGRSRPGKEDGSLQYNLFEIDRDMRSFPSGHSATVFSMASVIAGQYNNIWIGAGVYGFAGLAALSRVYHDEHWISDVIAGSALGALIGKAVVHLNKPGDRKLTLLPYFYPERSQYGVNLIARH